MTKLDLYVPTTPYGSEGLMPLACPQYPDNSVSCAGAGGGSFCGGFMGTAVDEKRGVTYVLCQEAKLQSEHTPGCAPPEELVVRGWTSWYEDDAMVLMNSSVNGNFTSTMTVEEARQLASNINDAADAAERTN